MIGLILIAAVPAAAAQATARAEVRILAGERIRFEAPAPHLSWRETRRVLVPGETPVILRLVEFQ